MDIFPIKLKGKNLGERHHNLNDLVNDAYKNNVSLASVQNLPEESELDRFFKIDLALKSKNVDYLMEMFKDLNILYVSRALKCPWLIIDPQYSHIINPTYLEENLFPKMMTTAVTKFNHLIELNLNDEFRCQHFYKYYYEKENFRRTLHFLPKCEKKFILTEIEKISQKIEPNYLKRLCEKCPDVAVVFFDSIVKNEYNYDNYRKRSEKFFAELKFLLKFNPDIYLDIIESHFKRSFKRLSPDATKFILNEYRQRFDAKPELYAAWILDLKTLGKNLNSIEITSLLSKLASAKYLGTWFSYKNVEPLLKQLNRDDRKLIVNKLFVEKSIGEVETSPYPFPSEPEQIVENNLSSSLLEFDDDNRMIPLCGMNFMCQALEKRSYCMKKYSMKKTLMDELYDKYRFTNFSKTFSELRQRLKKESSHRNRLMILTVLVTKSKSNEANVSTLLKYFIENHMNEPITLKISFVRSLVVQVSVYRLSIEIWSYVQKILDDMGAYSGVIEGGAEHSECTHAIIIHNVLHNENVPEPIVKIFLREFDPLVKYKMNSNEKQKIFKYLYSLLLSECDRSLKDNKLRELADIIWKIFGLLQSCKVDVRNCENFLKIIKTFAELDFELSQPILSHLYEMKICRKLFFQENFNINQNEMSYLNALKHDANCTTEKFKKLISTGAYNHDAFLTKVKIYFNDDLAKQYLLLIEEHLTSNPDNLNAELASALRILSSDNIPDTSIKKYLFKRRFLDNQKTYQSSIKSLVHNSSLVGLRNVIYPQPEELFKGYVDTLLKEDIKVVKLCIILTFEKLKGNDLIPLSKIFCLDERKMIRKVLLLKLHWYICSVRDPYISELWVEMKMILKNPNIDFKSYKKLLQINLIPSQIKVDYCTTIYNVFNNIKNKDMNEFYYAIKPILHCISNNLEKIDSKHIYDMINYFIEKEFVKEKIWKGAYEYDDSYVYLNLKIIARFLLINKTETILEEKFNIAVQFLNKIQSFWNETDDNKRYSCRDFYKYFIRKLKYFKAFSNPEYVSCVPLFERILSMMRKFMPVYQYFGLYSQIHLTLLFFKAIQQSMKHDIELFKNDKITDEAVAKVGFLFGQYIGYEFKALVSKYYISIRDMYGKDLVEYMRHYFRCEETKSILLIEIFKGLCEDKENIDGLLLAVFIYKELLWSKETKEVESTYNLLKEINNLEVEMFLNHNARKLAYR